MTTRHAGWIVVAVAALLGAMAPACAEPGAAPSDAVRVSVGADITFDPESNIYTYSYRVTNEPSSARDIWQFKVSTGARVDNVSGPPGWTVHVDAEHGVISWAATIPGPPPTDVEDGVVPAPPSSIKPGGTVGGFSFQSLEPPVPARFRALGVAYVPPSVDDGASDEASDLAHGGTTLGPRQAPGAPAQRLTIGAAYSAARR